MEYVYVIKNELAILGIVATKAEAIERCNIDKIAYSIIGCKIGSYLPIQVSIVPDKYSVKGTDKYLGEYTREDLFRMKNKDHKMEIYQDDCNTMLITKNNGFFIETLYCKAIQWQLKGI